MPGATQLEQALGTTLGRSTVDVVTTMPGWLLEANAVLHPRGSEYDTQYVIDGMPLYDNRSIAFAPAFENSEFEAVNILTAGIPAEYGRRLGGVIALDTRRVGYLGHRSEVDLQGGSYDTYIGSFSHQYSNDKTAVLARAFKAATPAAIWIRRRSRISPTRRAPAASTRVSSTTSAIATASRSISARTAPASWCRTIWCNKPPANARTAGRGETAGQIHYQHIFSSRTLGSLRGMVRDLTSELWSNELSTPVYVQQDRGFREGAVIGDVTVESERHTLKFGGDLRVNNIRESVPARRTATSFPNSRWIFATTGAAPKSDCSCRTSFDRQFRRQPGGAL